MTPINPNDPRITAYALGEMDEAGRAEFEKLLEGSEEGRFLVEQVRSLAGLLSEELAKEPKPVLTPAQRAAVEKGAAKRISTPERAGFWPWLMQPFRLATAVSVCLLLVVAVHWNQSKRDMDLKQSTFETLEELGRMETVEAPPPAAPAPISPLLASAPTASPETWGVLGGRTEVKVIELNRSKEKQVQLGWQEQKPSIAAVNQTDSLSSQIPAKAPQDAMAGYRILAEQEVVRGHPATEEAGKRIVSGAAVTPVELKTAGDQVQLGQLVRKQDFYLDDFQSAQPERQLAESKAVTLLERCEPIESEGVESYSGVTDNPFKPVSDEPLSTFSIDVDTASYANVRRFLNQGQLPPKDAVRIEEMINYFPYDYAPPTGEDPFAAHVEIVDCPWSPDHRLARIGLAGKEIRGDDRAGCNLVFLIDVSGSMEPENKLPLVKRGMLLLLNQLRPHDKVAIVTYAGDSELALSSTSCENKPLIQAAIEKLRSGGSTNGAGGIVAAYKTAQDSFIRGGDNRVILATDGDFNVGVTSPDELNTVITDKAKSGIYLSVLGFGMGNLKDSTLESLADKGNGNYAYIDTLQEARKVLVDQLAGTLVTIAKDVKIQIEFNPGKVGAYRLIGYENRTMAAQDFNDDRKDAGEIGAGHTVTALYEVVPVGAPINLAGVDPLKYQKPAAAPAMETVDSPELFTLKLRYKQPDGDTSKLIEVPVMDRPIAGVPSAPSMDLKFAAAVASFGMLLRESPYRGSANFDSVAALAREGKGEDRDGYRTEFIQLVGLAKALKP